MNSEKLIELSDISFKFTHDKAPLFEHVNLTIEKGSFTGVVGSSGIGKTTLIKIINGILHLGRHSGLSGEISFKGTSYRDLDQREINRHIGTVFQDPDNQILFSNVEDELAFGMENYGIKRDEMVKRIDHTLGILGMEFLRDRDPNHLSGGEKQLVVLAAILCLDVDVIVLDECMAQVDAPGRELILEALKRLHADGRTLIMIEHDWDNLKWVDRIYNLEEKSMTKTAGEQSW